MFVCFSVVVVLFSGVFFWGGVIFFFFRFSFLVVFLFVCLFVVLLKGERRGPSNQCTKISNRVSRVGCVFHFS